MTEGTLDPRVRSLLEDELEKRDIEMGIVERMLELAQRSEGEHLRARLRELLGED